VNVPLDKSDKGTDMTKEQIAHYRKAAEDGTIPDDQNPLFLLQGVHIDLLLNIINRDFNVVRLAVHELADRGLNLKGEWVGFDNAGSKKRAVNKKGRRL